MFSFSYSPRNSSINTHLESIGKVIDLLSVKYEHFIVIGDINVTEFNISEENSCNIYSFKNLIKIPTCFKNPYDPNCIDLTMTNRSKSFQNFCVTVIESSDFHKKTVSVLGSHLPK